MNNDTLTTYLEEVIAIATHAGKLTLPYYKQKTSIIIEHKQDLSPLTQADIAAHEYIIQSLQDVTPHIPVLSEESADIAFAQRQQWQRYWLVDPLDGTKEFIKGSDEFSVNIALIDQHQSILGVIYAPIFDECYYALKGEGAYKMDNKKNQRIQTHACDLHRAIRIAVSRNHCSEKIKQFAQNFSNVAYIKMGSSLKTCLVAEGKADIYLRLGPTSEWDTAAAQCIIQEAGGSIIDVQGQQLRYNCKPSLLNPWFLATGDNNINWLHYLPKVLNNDM